MVQENVIIFKALKKNRATNEYSWLPTLMQDYPNVTFVIKTAEQITGI